MCRFFQTQTVICELCWKALWLHSFSTFKNCLYKVGWTKSLLVESCVRGLAAYLLYWSPALLFLSCL